MYIYKAAICDDDIKSLRLIRDELQKAYHELSFKIQFECFSTAEALLNTIYASTHFDILFLDIDMPDMNGIDLCRKIRKIFPEILVVFISGKEDLVFQSMEVAPFRFVRKSRFWDELTSLVRDTTNKFNEVKEIPVTIDEMHSKKVYAVDLLKVYYIESFSKYCCFFTATGDFRIQYRIKNLEARLADYGFLKPHRSYLINYRYIFSIQNDHVILDNHATIPLSRNRRQQLKESFLQLHNGDIL